jgi:long-chain acyl-CoA synthetase
LPPTVYTGIILNFPEKPETVRENVREIAPEGILYNSRLWESLVGMVQVSIKESTWLNRKTVRLVSARWLSYADKKLSQAIRPAWG